jgi:hypothetical protein
VAALSKAWNVFARSNTGSWVRIDSRHGCVFLFILLYSGLATDWSPTKGSCRLFKIKKLKWNEAFHRCPTLQVGATGIEETAVILVLRIDSLTSSIKNDNTCTKKLFWINKNDDINYYYQVLLPAELVSLVYSACCALSSHCHSSQWLLYMYVCMMHCFLVWHVVFEKICKAEVRGASIFRFKESTK